MATMSARSATLNSDLDIVHENRPWDVHSRILHGGSPFLHGRSPGFFKKIGLGYDVGCVQARICGLVRGLLAHLPKEATFRVRRMCTDIQRPLGWFQGLYNPKTRFVCGTFRLFCVLECDPDLVAELWALIFLQLCGWLIEIIFH